MNILFLIGRVIYGAFFIMMGLNHLGSAREGLVGYAASKGIPAPKLAVVGSGILLLVGGLSIITGFMPVVGIIALVLFLAPVSFQMHNFWAVDDPQAKMSEMTQFLKNMALLGAALIFLAIQTPWVLSL